jgi:sugar fermentation stimulation protein A
MKTNPNEKSSLIWSYPHPLEPGAFVKRYKRFLAEVKRPDGHVDVVHCANSGSMQSCLIPGAQAYTLDSLNPNRKLAHTLEFLELEDGLACLNTSRANSWVLSLMMQCTQNPSTSETFTKALGLSPTLHIKPEVYFDFYSRFDFCLTDPQHTQKRCWIEVKTVSLKLDETTYAFPDAVTSRGQKHMKGLTKACQKGDDAWLLFVIMRGSKVKCRTIYKGFRTAHEIDPTYAELFDTAVKNKVRVGILIPTLTLNGFGFRSFYEWT